MKWTIALCSIPLLLCTGCAGAGYEQFQRVVMDMQAQGTITMEQAKLLLDAIHQVNAGVDWGQLAMGTLSSVVFALTGVRIWRGPATKPETPAPAKP